MQDTMGVVGRSRHVDEVANLCVWGGRLTRGGSGRLLHYNFHFGKPLSGTSPNHLLHLTAEAEPILII